MTSLMLCNRTIASFGAAVVSVVAAACSYGAAAAFSDDGNHVYLLGSKLPKGTVLDVDLTNFTAKELSLGVTTEVRGVANAPRALLFVTEKSLYRRPLPDGEVGKICDAPAGSYFEDVACNRAKHGILLLCHTKDFRDWPAYYLREQESKPTSLVLRRVNALVGAVFDRDGHLFFASSGDLWEGDITTPSEPGEEPPAVEASRFAPVALLETANTTPNSTGARELAVAGRTVYARMGRMGGSGWGEIISVHWPGEPKGEDGKAPSIENGIKPNVETLKSALGPFRAYGPNPGASYLCGSPDGKKVFFATRDTEGAGDALRFYLGDEFGEVHPLDQLKIEESAQPGGATPADTKPVSITAINPKTGNPVPPEQPVRNTGNIKMTFSDGHSEIVASDGGLPRVSERGDAGWIDREENLIIRRLTGKVSTWKTDPGDLSNTAIESWGFADHGTAIVVHWTGRHLLRNFFKYDMSSGRVTARVHHPQSYKELPAWAKAVASPDDFSF